MNRTPLSFLTQLLQNAQKRVPLHSKFSHYLDTEQKSPYEIVGHAIHESTEEPLIIYKKLDSNEITWARTLKDFESHVVLNDSIVPRFQMISKERK